MAKGSRIRHHVWAVGGLTGLSRVLGLVREMLTSRLIGVSLAQSAFVFAFTIPNLFRKLLGEGALSAAFVPIFKEQLEQGNREDAQRLACAVGSMMGSFLLLLSGIAIGVMSFVLPHLDATGRTAMVIRLTRIMLPYAFLICSTAFAMGIQHALGRYKRASFASSILNLVWIAVLVGLYFFPESTVEQRVTAVAWGVFVSGILQMAYLFRAVWQQGIRLRPRFRGWWDSQVRRVWRNTLGAALGMGAVQINLVFDNTLALWAAPWAPAAISYAERLVYLPLGVVATAFATVLLPTLSGHFAKQDQQIAKATWVQAFLDVLWVSLPAALGLFLLSRDIVALVYQGGAFTVEDTERVTRALGCYAPGLVVFSLNKILTPWFYAQQDTQTPMRIALGMVGGNFILNVLMVVCLPVEWKHAGIASSTVICSFLSSLLLYRAARRKSGSFGLRSVLPAVMRRIGSTLVMGLVVFFLHTYLTQMEGMQDRLGILIRLVSCGAVGGAVYCLLTWQSKVKHGC